ncbi:unnamed protein product [Rhizoctonia solani]|uniref:Protein kinase domain-containing protein n=1 Tax=Rhizoctonia solani TaxID=456999 RepID=A0A8H3CUY7_9AGAM|nr:unnamed protein product [Rhizoctonia solani]
MGRIASPFGGMWYYAGGGGRGEQGGTVVSSPRVLPTYSQGEATYAEVLSRLSSSIEIGLDLSDALKAFRLFLEVEENITVGRGKLKVLRSQSVYVLEECVWYRRQGGDLSQILPDFIQSLFDVSEQVKSTPRLDHFIQDSHLQVTLEFEVGKAFHKLLEQLKQLTEGKHVDPLCYKTEFEDARNADRRKIEYLGASIKACKEINPDLCNIREGVKPMIDHYLNMRAAGDPTHETGRKQITDANQTLAILAELSGQPVPPLAIASESSLEMDSFPMNESVAYTVHVGKHFTGEKVIIKLTKAIFDKEAAAGTYSRFSQLRENWTALKHDRILPLYGLGIMQTAFNPTVYRLYFLYPYLRNQDAGTYLKVYPTTSRSARLQMVVDIAQGLKYMHSEYILPDGRGVVHGALNIHNVLVKDSGRAVISGFGHTEVLSNPQLQGISSDDYDRYRYSGPEFLNDVAPEPTFGCDIWSWAMTSLEVLTSKPPFGHISKGAKLIQEILTKLPKRADHPSIEDYEHKAEVWKLLEDCWERKPEDRPNANTVSAIEILRKLSENGYADITAQINIRKCSSTAIGQGGTGDVFQGYLVDGSKVAIKCPRNFDTSEEDGREALKAIAKEGYLWLKHRHANVLEIFGLALFRNHIALVSPWMENGTVLNYVKKQPTADRLNLCSQIACGLTYLHEQGTIHGDLKAINVLVSDDGVAKIIDFGSTVMNQYSLQFSGGEKAHHCTIRWAAPELMEAENASVSRPSDVYALAMVNTLERFYFLTLMRPGYICRLFL